MLVPVEAVGDVTQDKLIKMPEGNPPKKESTGLASYVETQNKNAFTSEKARTEALRNLMGSEFSLADSTYNTYATVLANEYLALQNGNQKLDDEQKRNMPEWFKLFAKNTQEAFNAKYPTAIGSNRDEQYAAYFSTFQDLLRSKDPEEAKQWLNSAMLATKRQVLALQVSTGAHIEVLREAEKIDHVSEVEAASALLSQESGVSLAKVKADMMALRSTGPDGKNLLQKLGSKANDFLRFTYESFFKEPGRTINWGDQVEVDKMMEKYRIESRKRIHSDIDVKFDMNTFDANRPYYHHDLAGNEVQRQLDPVQKEFLANLEYTSRVANGDRAGMLSRTEVDRLIKKLTYAQQNAYFVEYDEQLRSDGHLNLVGKRGNRLFMTGSPLGNVNPDVEGVPALPIGLDEKHFSLDNQLTLVMRSINETVTEKVRDRRVTGDIKDTVGQKITELDKSITERKLSPAEEQVKSAATGAIVENTADLASVNEFLQLQSESSITTAQKLRKETELKPAIHLRDVEIRDKNSEITVEDVNIATADREKKSHEKRVTILHAEKTRLETDINRINKDLVELKVKYESALISIPNLATEIISLTTELTTALGIAGTPAKKIDDLRKRLAEKQKEHDNLNTFVTAEYVAKEPAYTRDRDAKQLLIDDPITGVEAKILAEEAAIDTSEKNRLEAIAKKDQLKIQLEDLNKQLATLEQDFTDLANLQRQEKNSQAKLEAIYLSLKTKYGLALPTLIGHVGPIDLDGNVKSRIEAQIKAQQAIIDRLEGGKGVQNAIDSHQKEVLTAFQDHFLDSTKWTAIKNRARQPLTEIVAAASLGNKDSFAPLDSFLRKNKHVLPAYARTIHILGGDEVLNGTVEGKKMYQEISSVVTPDYFFKQFKAQYGAELSAKLGLVNLPADLTIFDKRLTDPNIMEFMMRQVDRKFMKGLLNDTVRQAEKLELGKIRAQDITKFQDIAYREASIGDEAMEKEEALKDREIQESRIQYEFASDQRRKEFVGQAVSYLTAPAGLNLPQTDVIKVVRAVRKVAHEGPIVKLSLNPAEYRTIEGTVDRIFGREGLVLNVAQKQEILNRILPMELSAEDVQSVIDLNALPGIDTILTGAGFAITPAETTRIQTNIKDRLLQLGINVDQPLSDTVLTATVGGRTVEDMLHESITTAVIAGALPGGFTRDNLKAIVDRISYRTQASREQGRLITKVPQEFIEKGASIKEGILLQLLMSEMDVTSAKALEKALYNLGNTDLPTQMATLLDYIPNEYKGYIIGHKILVTNVLERFISRTARRAVVFDDPNISSSQVEVEANGVLKGFRQFRRIPPVPISTRNAINSEVVTYDNMLKVQMERARIDDNVQAFNQTFWGLNGKQLISAIEKELGGVAYRDQAIKMAHAVEQKRKNP